MKAWQARLRRDRFDDALPPPYDELAELPDVVGEEPDEPLTRHTSSALSRDLAGGLHWNAHLGLWVTRGGNAWCYVREEWVPAEMAARFLTDDEQARERPRTWRPSKPPPPPGKRWPPLLRKPRDRKVTP